MALPKRWLEPGVLEQLRQRTVMGDVIASRALRQWDRRRRAPVRSRERRVAQRAFIRLAEQVLGEQP
jgi:hypothetical protein